MRNALVLLTLVAVSLFALLAAPTRAQGKGAAALPVREEYAPDRVIVCFKGDVRLDARIDAVQRLGLAPVKGAQSPFFATLQIPAAQAQKGDGVTAALAALRKDPTVRYAEPVYYRYGTATPNDAEFTKLWGLHNIGQVYRDPARGTSGADIDAPEAWDRIKGAPGNSVKVAVLDTGIDYNHPDIRPNYYFYDDGKVSGWDFHDNDNNPTDTHGHGTHVAGTIGAQGNNSIGVIGVCHDVSLISLRVLVDNNRGTVDNVIKGIDWARNNGCRIVNMSLGQYTFSQAEHDACLRARDAGLLLVAAAGNDGADVNVNPHYPACYRDTLVLSVAASNSADEEPDFTNIGATNVDLFAPGVDIYSTQPGNRYQYLDGTSMATPHVAGAAALLLASEPGLSRAALRSRILDMVDPIDAFAGRCVTGGRLNVFQMLGDRWERDNTWQTAQVLTQNRTVQDRTFHVAEDEDWYKITATGTFELTVETDKPFLEEDTGGRTAIYLFGSDPTGSYIELSNPGGWATLLRTGAKRLPKGTYYILIDNGNSTPLRGYEAEINVSFGFDDLYEVDDTWQQAKLIDPSSDGVRSISLPGNDDWAKFVVTDPSDVTIETRKAPRGPEGKTELYLYKDPSSSPIAASRPDGWAKIVRTGTERLAPGTYYILVRENFDDEILNGYELILTLTKAFVDSFEADDTRETAKLITPSSSKLRSIHLPGNDDWAKFVLTKAADVTIETRQASGGPVGKTELYLYPSDPASNPIDSNRPDGWAKIVRSGANRLAPGTYYIRLRENFNDEVLDKFELVLTIKEAFYDSFEADDTRDTAKLITPSSSKVRSIHLPGNEDWAKFVLAHPSDVTIETRQATGGPTGKTELYLYPSDPASNAIDSNRPDGWARLVRSGANRLAPGTYYILLRENFNDEPIDKLELVLNIYEGEPDAFEVDDTWQQAKVIPRGASQVRSIHQQGNQDWAKFTLTKAADVTIETTGAPTGSKTALYLFGDNPDGGYMEANDPDGLARIERKGDERLEPGTYYILVNERFNDEPIDLYRLNFIVTDGPVDAFEVDDTWQQAKGIAAGQTQSRSIHQQGNQDWAKFTLTAPSAITINTTSTIAGANTVLYLFGDNPDNGYIEANDPAGLAKIERGASNHLEPGTYYILVNERFNDGVLDNYKLALTVTALPRPPKPTNVTARPTSAFEVEIKWNDPANNELGFRIQRKEGEKGTYADVTTTGPNVTSFLDPGLTPETLYLYQVSTVGEFVNSEWAGPARATTPADKPNPPSNLTAFAVTPTEIELEWDDNSNNEVYFIIERKAAKGAYQELPDPVPHDLTEYVDTDLKPNTRYTYRIKAVGNVAPSDWSNEASATTIPANAPDLLAEWGAIKFKPGKNGNPGKLTGSFSVKNIGDVASVATKIIFYKSTDDELTDDDVKVFEMEVPALKPGKSWKKNKKNPKFSLQVPNGKSGGSALKGLRAVLFVDPIPPNANREKEEVLNNIAATGPLP